MPDRRSFVRLLSHPRADPAIAAGLTALCLFELIVTHGSTAPRAAVLEVILICASVSLLRTRPATATCLAAVVLVAATPLDESPPSVSGGLVMCALAYACGAYAPLLQGGLAVAALAAATQISVGFSEFPNVEIAFSTFLPFWVGHQVGLRSRLVVQLREQARQLQDEQDAFARLSVRRERARIARELHDVVAHHLAVIVVQAGAGRMAQLASADRAAERLATIRHSGAEALSEMARLVDILHTDEGSAERSRPVLQKLIEQARAGGLVVEMSQRPPGASLPAALNGLAHQIIREALTNAIKHAPGSEVTIALVLDNHGAEIEVRDGGARVPVASGRVPVPGARVPVAGARVPVAGASVPVAGAPVPVPGAPVPVPGTRVAAGLTDAGAGLGLVGMRERVEAIGGQLEVGPASGGGWCLHATLPLPAALVTAG